eukprot:Anaeramoba_ignava/a478997_10.p3 GENE.a478997_10~~a478997_10.p3  ORF type:complete len:274 (+),score=47.91 a478997_10:2054-2875(+)
MKKSITFILIGFLFVACSKEKSKTDYIARVNDSYLPTDEVAKIIKVQNLNMSDSHIGKSIVTKWVKEEIIYQKAKKEHFDKDQNIKRKVENYYRSLVVDEYLKYHFQSNVTISNQEIEDYYNNNKEMFQLQNDALKISHVFVEDYNDAKTIKSILESYVEEDKKELYKHYKFETKIIQKGEVVKDLNTELFEKNSSKIIGPVSSNYGFHIIEILDRYSKGDYKPLSIVRDEIYQTILQEKDKSEYILFNDEIISNADYEINEAKLEGLLRKND